MSLQSINTSIAFTEFSEADLSELHDLNESEVPHLGSVTLEKLSWLCKKAVFLKISKNDKNELLGFILCFDEKSDYESQNFLWFKARYSKFTYVDRIAVSKNSRRLGIGRLLYEAVKNYAKVNESPIITCEVNLLPPNPASMKFHLQLGFHEAGTLSSENGTKKVSMLVKP